ncbi:MAG: hypothetical protein KJ017_06415 [Alphaproteobacteria bacterium]|nr:hypothetical protein [Alphaproteobacteria bacterium]
MPTRPEDFTLDLLLEYLARGHGFAKHGEGLDAQRHMDGVRSFRDTTNAASTEVRAGAAARNLGPDLHINTPEDLKDYMRRMLTDPATEGFVERNGTIQLFNRTDNTRLIINPLDNSGDFGTIHRYPSSLEGFRDAKLRVQRDMGRSLVQFDNSVTRDAALNRVQGVVDNVRTNPNTWRTTLANDPGVKAAAQYSGSQNLSRTGVSADYAAHAATIDRVNGLRAGLDYGRGYVAQTDSAGRPSQMFFWDQRTNVVTEVNGRELIQHTFDNLPEAERARLAEQFFELNKPANAVITEGGYDALVRAHQSAHSVQGPAVASTKSQLIAALQDGRVTGTANVPYESVDDAARILVGFSREQGQAFDLVPSRLNAEALEQIQDPAVVAAIRDLSATKEMAFGEDGATALQMFAERFNQMDEATRANVARALENMARSPLPDAARATGLAADAAHAADALNTMGDLATLARTAKAGRIGLNFSKAGVVTAVVTTGLAVGLTSAANAAVLDIADQLHASGRLSDAAHADYRAMMDDVGTMLTAQAADPTVLAIPGTFIVESIAHNRFQEFSDRHQLPQDIHEMLSPSIYSGSSVRGEIGDNTFRTIPDDPSQAAPELRALIEAKQGVMQARQDYSRTYDSHRPPAWSMALSQGAAGGLGAHLAITGMPDVKAAQTVVDQAQARFQTEFDRLLSNPQGARALASLLTNDQLLEIVDSTAKFNNSPGQHPLIQEFVRAQALDAPWYSLTGAWDNMKARDAAREALLNNPEVMRDYLSGVFVPRQAASPAQTEALDTSSQQRVTLSEAPVLESSGNGGHLAGFSFTMPPIPQSFIPGRLEHHYLPLDGTSVNITDTYQYTFIANAFERLQCGQGIEPQEHAEITRYLNDPGRTYMDEQIINSVRLNYPDVTARYAGDDHRSALPRADNLTGTFRNWTHPLISLPYIQPIHVDAPTLEPLETPLNRSLRLQVTPLPEIGEPVQLRPIETQKF